MNCRYFANFSIAGHARKARADATRVANHMIAGVRRTTREVNANVGEQSLTS